MVPDFIAESEVLGPAFALAVFAGMVLVASIIQVVLSLVIRRRKASSPDALDTEILSNVRGPIVLFFMVFGLFLAFLILTGLESSRYDTLDGVDDWVRKIWAVVIIAEVSYLASRLTQILMAWYLRTISSKTSTDLDAKLLPPVKRVLPMAIYSLGALIALDSLGISISPMLAGLGIGGLAVALAVQPTLSNFFAGTYLVTEGELRSGDFIELDGGPSGFVVDVGWRSTKVRSRFNNLVIIPNSKMVDTIVTNYYSPTPAMNVVIDCGVAYESNLAHVERVALQATNEVIARSDHAIKDVEPFFGFSAFGDSNIDFFVFFQATDRLGSFVVKSEAIKRIHERFNEEGIEINYPVRKLLQPPVDAAQALPPPDQPVSG